MHILAIETTGAFASVAIIQNDKILANIKGNDRFSHLQNLTPQVDAVVKESKLSLDDIEAIAVSCGPGSFTGIRIGVSSARALSQILNIPCIAVSSLQALALGAVEYVNKAYSNKPVLVCPMLDARRNQIYGGGYFIEGGYPVEKIQAGPYMLDEFMSEAEKYDEIVVLGDGIDKYEQEMVKLRSGGIELCHEDIRYQDAVSVARLGMKIYGKQGGVAYNMLEPDYMRLAEAERKLREKQKKVL